MTRPVNPAVRGMIEEIVEEEGYELVELEYKTGKFSCLQVLIHQKGGVNLDDCTRLSRTIDRRLEDEEAIRGPYRLDVASPGLDRLLRTTADFRRALGEKVRLALTESMDGRKDFEGSLEEATEASLRLSSKKGTTEIPMALVDYGKIVVEMFG